MSKTYKCPHDGTMLTDVSVVTYSCPTCEGVLLDLAKSKIPAFKKIPELMKDARSTDLKCPLSGGTMDEFLIGSVRVDYCGKSQAMWFDKGEYKRVKSFCSRKLKVTTENGSSITDLFIDVAVDGAVEIVLEGLGSLVGGIFD